MKEVLLVIHVLACVGMIVAVLMQRSEGGALGIGGGSSSLISGRGASDALVRATTVLGTIFFCTSLALTLLVNNQSGASRVEKELEKAKAGSVLPAPAPALPTIPLGSAVGTPADTSANPAIAPATGAIAPAAGTPGAATAPSGPAPTAPANQTAPAKGQ